MASDVVYWRAIQTGLRKGLNGGHWGWYALAGCAVVLRHINRVETGATHQVAAKPGQTLIVTVSDPPPKKRRKKA